ncbi:MULTISPECIES: MmgE/PrpD family protein [unclassified Achromobacter]|uniref:MmgE/PrpD family protein n=1 Tax=unclassified Achromobacter TaxID=2626865 RepID=UPI000B519ED8|nr:MULTISPECIES: MmgE/PrpD family protein [unclassified Achromobacter]OWT75424.1 2-methylcitrate dehydratase [Achromobacter sp. HZ28]OWT76084.1 2-methylcitrate dehydratase [Achromobacter sp. HZ34]
MDIVVDAIAGYAAHLTYDALPDAVVERTKHLILDTVGCALGAAGSLPARIATAMAGAVQAKTPATVMITGMRTTPDLAAFANGTLVRYLDYNDTYTGRGTVHPSDMFAAALAAAECAGGDGRALILGTVLGYEVLCNLADNGAMQRNGEASEWDQATYGVIAAAAVAARLMGLAQDQTAHAVSLAISSHMSLIQIRHGQISHWKGCALANAARNGIFCAQLAAQGMTGPGHIFDGKHGFFQATGINFEMLPFGGAGNEFRIMSARVKPFPAGYFSQSAIEAVLELRPQIPDVAHVRKIHLETFPSGHRIMGSDESRWRPETRESADHSLPFVMAMALIDGCLKERHYDEGRFKDEDVRAVMAKIAVSVGEESVKAWPAVPLNVLRIELDNGRDLVTRVSHHLGHYTRLMTDAQQEAKFRDLAQEGAALPQTQVTQLLDRLRKLESETDLSGLLKLTVKEG